jgi:hypothetical protein
MIMLLQYTRHIRLTFICHYWEDFRREVARWLTHWIITKSNDLPTTLCTTLDSVNPVLYPSIDTIWIKLCVLLNMSVASATAERSFSVLRCLKNYVWSTIKNDRLSSHGLVYIHRGFEVDVYKAMEVFVSAKTRRADFWQFYEILVYQSHYNCAWFYVIWNPKMAPDRTILHLVKKKTRSPPPLKNYGVHTNKPQLRPWICDGIS